MQLAHHDSVLRLLADLLGPVRASALLETLEEPRGLPLAPPGAVHRSALAFALAALLFEDVVRRVPVAAAYVEDRRRAGKRILLDHGALRTVAADCGRLPVGRAAFARLLEPLGYARTEVYDLARLAMTGHAYTHRDAPEALPQYFVSELHPERFESGFRAAVERVVGRSRDPLSSGARDSLARLADGGSLPHACATRLLPELVACFDRQHPLPSLADYQLLLERSAEMAWIATEGNAFNHATDRVADVFAVADEQRRLDRPMKTAVEVSRSGLVLQTAFRATTVERAFVDEAGDVVLRRVPGSFHEFITRRRREDGSLDLAFDASNAQGIFGMTDGSLAG